MKPLCLLLAAILVAAPLLGCITGPPDYDYEPSEDLFIDEPDEPVCTIVVTPGEKCEKRDIEVDYNEYGCAERKHRYRVYKVDVNHSPIVSGGCHTEFTVPVHNRDYFKGDFNVGVMIFDNDLAYVKTIWDEKTVDANEVREFELKYDYTCGQSRIVNYDLNIIVPERLFCEWTTKTKTERKRVCWDVNIREEVCE